MGGQVQETALTTVVTWRSVPGTIASMKDVKTMTSPTLAEVPWTAVVVCVGWGLRLRGSKTCDHCEYICSVTMNKNVPYEACTSEALAPWPSLLWGENRCAVRSS